MPNTFELIASSTVGAGGASNIDFTSIPSTYTDLCVKFSGRISSNGEGYPIIRFNNDSGSNYSFRNLTGSGSSASSSSGSGTYINLYAVPGTSYTANTFGSIEIYIPNYTGSTSKSVSSESTTENNSSTSYLAIIAGLWTGTAAINRITLSTQSGTETMSQYSTAYLYGIKNS